MTLLPKNYLANVKAVLEVRTTPSDCHSTEVQRWGAYAKAALEAGADPNATVSAVDPSGAVYGATVGKYGRTGLVTAAMVRLPYQSAMPVDDAHALLVRRADQAPLHAVAGSLHLGAAAEPSPGGAPRLRVAAVSLEP